VHGLLRHRDRRWIRVDGRQSLRSVSGTGTRHTADSGDRVGRVAGGTTALVVIMWVLIGLLVLGESVLLFFAFLEIAQMRMSFRQDPQRVLKG
jgi:hypothetical protein